MRSRCSGDLVSSRKSTQTPACSLFEHVITYATSIAFCIFIIFTSSSLLKLIHSIPFNSYLPFLPARAVFFIAIVSYHQARACTDRCNICLLVTGALLDLASLKSQSWIVLAASITKKTRYLTQQSGQWRLHPLMRPAMVKVR